MEKKIDSFQILRAIAVILVFISYCTGIVPFRASYLNLIGVSIFFVLSGYLTAYVHFDKNEENIRDAKDALIKAKDYALRKVGKYANLYYVMLIISVAYVVIVNKIYSLTAANQFGFFGKFFCNVFLIQSWVFSTDYALSFNWPTWYLSTLLFMQIMTPLLLTWLRKSDPRKRKYYFLGVIGIRLLLSVVCIWAGSLGTYLLNFSPLSRIWDFGAGMLLYTGRREINEEKKHAGFGYIGILALIANIVLLRLFNDNLGTFRYFISLPFSLLAVFGFSFTGSAPIRALTAIKPLEYFGKIGSEFYIIHRMVIAMCSFVNKFVSWGTSGGLFFIFFAFMASLLATVLWRKLNDIFTGLGKTKRGKKDSAIIAWIIKVVGDDKVILGILMLIKILQGVEGTLFALSLSNVVNAATARNKDEVMRTSIVLAVVVISAVILHILNIYVKERANAYIEKRFRMHTYDQVMKRSYSAISARHSGEWMMRITTDSNLIYHALIETLPAFCGTMVQLGSAALALLSMYPGMTLALGVGGAFLIMFSLSLRDQLKQFQRDVQLKDSKVRSYIQEHMNNMIVIRSFNMEDNTLRIASEKSDELIKSKMKRTYFTTLCSSLMYGSIRIGYLAGAVICGYMIFQGRMNYGRMTAILQLVSLLINPIASISTYIPTFYTMLASAERIMEIEDLPLDHEEAVHSDTRVQQFYRQQFRSIGLENADFRYNENDYESTVIRNMSIDIRKGDYVALTGQSGCGKSTVIKLLMCLYPLNSGRVYLSTVDGKKMDMSPLWRNLFAYVPQGNYLESGTIREVVCFYNEELMQDDEAIWRALRVACCDEFVEGLPDKLETRLSERGAGLSEGQIQRIAIARAILSSRPILMLDECTSSLDENTEKKLLENLRKETDYTVVLITHRPAALSICNKKLEL